MKDKEFLMGIDVGTTALKVGVFDFDGNLIAESKGRYKLFSKHPTWGEENPEDWWSTLVDVSKRIKNEHLQNVKGICVGGQHPTLVSLDERGKPVKLAIIWMDRRAVCEAKALSEKLGIRLDPSDLLPKIMWIKNNEKEKYERVKWFMQSIGYIDYKLTDSPTSIAFYKERPPWPAKYIEAAGIDKDKFPQTKFMNEIVGEVTLKASKETGLPAGTPVVGGIIDAFASFLGAGTVEKGAFCEVGGTSDVVALSWDRPLQDALNRVWCFPHVLDGRWLIGAMTSTSGRSLDWFKNNFDPDKSYEEMIPKTGEVEAGSNNLIFLPYLCGERCPIWDPNARGVFFGLSTLHSKCHLTKAILESVGYSVKHNMEIISELGGEIKEVRVCGGQAKSDVWNQIKADIWGKELLIPSVLDTEVVGEAIIAGNGIKEFKNLEDAAKNFVRIKKITRPRKENYEKYSRIFDLYKKIYLHLKGDFKILSSLEGEA